MPEWERLACRKGLCTCSCPYHPPQGLVVSSIFGVLALGMLGQHLWWLPQHFLLWQQTNSGPPLESNRLVAETQSSTMVASMVSAFLNNAAMAQKSDGIRKDCMYELEKDWIYNIFVCTVWPRACAHTCWIHWNS